MSIKIAIVGGGLAGLITSLELSKKGVPSSVFEKRVYPFHKVCGEYVSNEVVPYLQSLQAYPESLRPSDISHFTLSSIRGQTATTPLDLGGFGLSRYNFDNFLYEQGKNRGVTFHLGKEIIAIEKRGDKFILKTAQDEFEADLVIGSFGKRSKIDVAMQRRFLASRSAFVGIKYHVRYPHDRNTVALHNFPGGYCGVAPIENDLINLCYLAAREPLKKYGDVQKFESAVVMRNPILKPIFSEVQFEAKPNVINEISFATKQPVEDNILMVGDAAGMVAPVFGNGMAIAIRTGKAAGNVAALFAQGKITRTEMEAQYKKEWNESVRSRLWLGRNVQRLFGSRFVSALAVSLMNHSSAFSSVMIRSSHGNPFS